MSWCLTIFKRPIGNYTQHRNEMEKMYSKLFVLLITDPLSYFKYFHYRVYYFYKKMINLFCINSEGSCGFHIINSTCSVFHSQVEVVPVTK